MVQIKLGHTSCLHLCTGCMNVLWGDCGVLEKGTDCWRPSDVQKLQTRLRLSTTQWIYVCLGSVSKFDLCSRFNELSFSGYDTLFWIESIVSHTDFGRTWSLGQLIWKHLSPGRCRDITSEMIGILNASQTFWAYFNSESVMCDSVNFSGESWSFINSSTMSCTNEDVGT